MNLQKPTSSNHIEWTRRILADGTRLPGYTWNVIGGCLHACRWTMPDGKVAICYAEDIAENGVAKSNFPHGFAHHYFHPSRLNEPLKVKEPAGIFLDSMSDLFGAWVPEDEIRQVLDVCRRAHWHTFFSLTKNAPRLLQFDFPPNVWVGASLPPDFMFGKPLSFGQKQHMLAKTLAVLAKVNATVRWISFEPLSWECAEIVEDGFNVQHSTLNAQHSTDATGCIQWAVIGAASDGRKYFPPRNGGLTRLLNVLDRHGVPVFYKGNLRSSPIARANWREGFPMMNGVNHKP